MNTRALLLRGLSAAAIAAALLSLAVAAQAQKAPAAKTEKKAKSACNSISDEAACKANNACSWIAALTDAKTGKQKRKAYCRTKPVRPAAKKNGGDVPGQGK